MNLRKYVTTKQAAEMLGVVTDHVNHLLIGGKLKGHKFGKSWMVYVPSVEKYLATKAPWGRPTSGTPTIQIEKPDGQE